jgi:hypothetical protein
MRQLYRLESPGFGQFREGWYSHGVRHHRGVFHGGQGAAEGPGLS